MCLLMVQPGNLFSPGDYPCLLVGLIPFKMATSYRPQGLVTSLAAFRHRILSSSACLQWPHEFTGIKLYATASHASVTNHSIQIKKGGRQAPFKQNFTIIYSADATATIKSCISALAPFLRVIDFLPL